MNVVVPRVSPEAVTFSWSALLTSKEVDKITKELASAHSLTHLFLSFCGINLRAVGLLVPVLARLPRLRHVNLVENRINDEGAEIIARDLLSHPDCGITHIFLAKNRITDRGARALARALLVNTRLREIHLSSNSITSAGRFELSRAYFESEAPLTHILGFLPSAFDFTRDDRLAPPRNPEAWPSRLYCMKDETKLLPESYKALIRCWEIARARGFDHRDLPRERFLGRDPDEIEAWYEAYAGLVTLLTASLRPETSTGDFLWRSGDGRIPMRIRDMLLGDIETSSRGVQAGQYLDDYDLSEGDS